MSQHSMQNFTGLTEIAIVAKKAHFAVVCQFFICRVYLKCSNDFHHLYISMENIKYWKKFPKSNIFLAKYHFVS